MLYRFGLHFVRSWRLVGRLIGCWICKQTFLGTRSRIPRKGGLLWIAESSTVSARLWRKKKNWILFAAKPTNNLKSGRGLQGKRNNLCCCLKSIPSSIYGPFFLWLDKCSFASCVWTFGLVDIELIFLFNLVASWTLFLIQFRFDFDVKYSPVRLPKPAMY